MAIVSTYCFQEELYSKDILIITDVFVNPLLMNQGWESLCNEANAGVSIMPQQ